MKLPDQFVKTTVPGIILSFLLIFLSLPSIADDKLKTITATGVAPIQGENLEGARQNAIQDALRQALEQGVEMMMNADTELVNDDLMEKIHTHAQGYFTGYKVIKERREKNGLYRVKVRAEIKSGELVGTLIRLGLIKQMMDYPRVMILPHPDSVISEASKTSETVFIKSFNENKFEVVDLGQTRKLRNELKQLFKMNSIENVAARIGLDHHAEIVVLYTLKTSGSRFDGIMANVPVELRTRAIVTTTAQILSAETKNLTGVGETPETACIEGARAVTEKACRTLMKNTLAWWSDYTVNGIPYIITLKTPPKSVRLVITFQKAIESMPGVISLTERSSGGGITQIMVKYKYESVQLKTSIIKALDRMEGFENLDAPLSKGRFLVFSVI